MAPGSRLAGMAVMMGFMAAPAWSSATADRSDDAQGPSAFRTERLSPRQLRLWNEIRKIVLRSDREGLPTHPILCGLWHSVERSGHLIFVELITDPERSSNVAAEFTFERVDPAGRAHALKLSLYIPTINRIYPREQAPRDGLEFVPHMGLTRKGRYAKVLGHELAHMELMFRDPDYERLLREICAEQNAIAAGIGKGFRTPESEAGLKERLARVWPKVLEAERPAVAAERQIYGELLRK